MPLTTDGLIEEIRRFRADKLALVGLIASMGKDSEADALERLRELISTLEAHLKEARSKNRGRLGASDELARDVLALAHEVEPWLSRAVERAKSA